MKTLTEFSPLLLRNAAAARAAAGGSPRRTPAPSPEQANDAVSASDIVAADASGAEAAETSGELPAEASATDGGESAGGESASGESAGGESDASASASEGDASASAGEGDALASAGAGDASASAGAGDASGDGEAKPKEKDPAIDAVAAALNVQPDRAERLLEALDIIGDRIDQVRLVRVFQGEAGPHGAVSRGEFHYVIDRVAGAQRGRRDDRGDRGGRGGRGERGDRRGGSGGGGGGGGATRRGKWNAMPATAMFASKSVWTFCPLNAHLTLKAL